MSRVRAPELPPDYPWLNCDRPLSLAQLKGRIVLLDFWTAGCINCQHVIPDLKYLEHRYADRLTVIGVHSAKFGHEAAIETVRQAILKYDITHPVLVDQNFYVWDQYAVKAWPTLMVIDPAGYVIGYVSGAGKLEILVDLVEKILIGQADPTTLPQLAPLILEKQHQPLIMPLAFPGKVLADAPSDALFIADSGHHRIVLSNLNGFVIQVIGDGQPGLRDGSFAEAQFRTPQGMAFDRAHHCLYVADSENHAIRKIDLRRQWVETIAGTGSQSQTLWPHCGRALETALNSPWDLQLIGETLFIAMAGAHQIWQMPLDSAIVMTYAGTGAEGCFDGLTTAAAFAQPSGIATTGMTLWVADSESSSIRAVDLLSADYSGTSQRDISEDDRDARPQVSTLCGSGDLFGFGDRDGTGATVRLQHCLGVDSTPTELWVADTYNHKIKRVNLATGECQTVLGTGQAGHQDGSRQVAMLAEPSGLSATSDYLYISDTNNHAIRQMNLVTWDVETIAFPGLCSPDVCLL
jgi:thiol-disulfide isomerase/thioredoxin